MTALRRWLSHRLYRLADKVRPTSGMVMGTTSPSTFTISGITTTTTNWPN